jgi:hypothetical protein
MRPFGCLKVLKDGRVSVEAVRIVKIPGASVTQSTLLDGYVGRHGSRVG